MYGASPRHVGAVPTAPRDHAPAAATPHQPARVLAAPGISTTVRAELPDQVHVLSHSMRVNR